MNLFFNLIDQIKIFLILKKSDKNLLMIYQIIRIFYYFALLYVNFLSTISLHQSQFILDHFNIIFTKFIYNYSNLTFISKLLKSKYQFIYLFDYYYNVSNYIISLFLIFFFLIQIFSFNYLTYLNFIINFSKFYYYFII